MPVSSEQIDIYSTRFDAEKPALLLPAESLVFEVCSSASFTAKEAGRDIVCRLEAMTNNGRGPTINIQMNPVVCARIAYQLLDLLNREGLFNVVLKIETPSGQIMEIEPRDPMVS